MHNKFSRLSFLNENYRTNEQLVDLIGFDGATVPLPSLAHATVCDLLLTEPNAIKSTISLKKCRPIIQISFEFHLDRMVSDFFVRDEV